MILALAMGFVNFGYEFCGYGCGCGSGLWLWLSWLVVYGDWWRWGCDYGCGFVFFFCFFLCCVVVAKVEWWL